MARDKNGWIKLHRQIIDSEFYKEPRKFSKSEAWIDILLRTNHKDTDNIKPGSLSTSYGELAKAWNWSKSKVWKFIRYLEKENMITIIQSGTANGTDSGTVLAIVNWALYQSKRTASRTVSRTIPEFLPILFKEEDIKNNLVVFNFWNEQQIIVHKKLTPAMEKTIDKTLQESTVEEIKTSISHYSKMLKDKKYEYCSYAWSLENFLNREKGYKLFLDDGEKWINYCNFVDKTKPRKEEQEIDWGWNKKN